MTIYIVNECGGVWGFSTEEKAKEHLMNCGDGELLSIEIQEGEEMVAGTFLTDYETMAEEEFDAWEAKEIASGAVESDVVKSHKDKEPMPESVAVPKLEFIGAKPGVAPGHNTK